MNYLAVYCNFLGAQGYLQALPPNSSQSNALNLLAAFSVAYFSALHNLGMQVGTVLRIFDR